VSGLCADFDCSEFLQRAAMLAFFGFFRPFGLQIFRLAFWPILAFFGPLSPRLACNRARQLYKNISMLFLFPVKRDLLFINI